MTGTVGIAGFAERYKKGRSTLFAGVAGIVVGLIALLTFSGAWVSLKPLLGFGANISYTLLETSEYAGVLGSVTAYFDSDMTTTFRAISIVATISHWVLLLGGILMIAASILLFVYPKAEGLALGTCAVVSTAFAIIGLAFTVAPILVGDYLSFTPLPIVMLICAGIPAVIYRVL